LNINTKFELPCGVTLKNRIAKAAMTERLAKADHLPNQRHCSLYDYWSRSGAGLLISGNVIIDKYHLEAAGNIVVDRDQPKQPFQEWVKSATSCGNHFWSQISHAGRQANIFSNLRPKAPSAVKLKKLGFFGKPSPMTGADVEESIIKFVEAAAFCKEVGFTGVQFHSAHGYLLSQFLSPRTNLRKDEWGGSIENRSRMLFTIVEKARSRLGSSFPISVKINSADFQRGGFEEQDALFVIKGLEERAVDLLEISGGTYENLVFLTEQKKRESTRSREAYFIDFARKVREQSQIPIMVTGGFRTLSFMNEVLERNELDMIGCARPFLLQEEFPKAFLTENNEEVPQGQLNPFSDKYLDLAEGGFYDKQIELLAKEKKLNLDYSANRAIWRFIMKEAKEGIRNRLLG